MSELKAYSIIGLDGRCNRVDNVYYLKSETDKVIAEKDKAIDELKAEINKYIELLYGKTEYHSVLAMCAIYGCKDVREFHSTINAAIDRSNTQINHQKYKRCLAMAELCDAEADVADADGDYEDMRRFQKWHNRWLKLADKFKPNN